MKQHKDYYAVIMAGGIGTRFWPASTIEKPKQFQDILGKGDSMLQTTFKRLAPLVAPSRISIATNTQYTAIVKEQLPKIGKAQIFAEPTMRNTAPCILANALKIANFNPNAIMIVAPSDHWIENNTLFLESIQEAMVHCKTHDQLVTLGIKPNHPNTGYGYIAYHKEDKNDIKAVRQFTEKPDLATATAFIESEDYLWNAGIFVWSVKSIISAFKTHLPQMYALLSSEPNCWNSLEEAVFLENVYERCENISIDFGILEKSKNVAVLPCHFNWSDLGTWGSLYQKKEKDFLKNVSIGTTVYYEEAKRNIVYSQNKDKKIVIQGIDDFIVVDKESVLMICPKSKEQEIKTLIADVQDFFGAATFKKL